MYHFVYHVSQWCIMYYCWRVMYHCGVSCVTDVSCITVVYHVLLLMCHVSQMYHTLWCIMNNCWCIIYHRYITVVYHVSHMYHRRIMYHCGVSCITFVSMWCIMCHCGVFSLPYVLRQYLFRVTLTICSPISCCNH